MGFQPGSQAACAGDAYLSLRRPALPVAACSAQSRLFDNTPLAFAVSIPSQAGILRLRKATIGKQPRISQNHKRNDAPAITGRTLHWHQVLPEAGWGLLGPVRPLPYSAGGLALEPADRTGIDPRATHCLLYCTYSPTVAIKGVALLKCQLPRGSTQTQWLASALALSSKQRPQLSSTSSTQRFPSSCVSPGLWLSCPP